MAESSHANIKLFKLQAEYAYICIKGVPINRHRQESAVFWASVSAKYCRFFANSISKFTYYL